MPHFLSKRGGSLLTSSLLLAMLMLSMLPAGQAFAQTHPGKQHTPPVLSKGTRRANDPTYRITADNKCGVNPPVAITPPLPDFYPVETTLQVTQGTGELVVYDDLGGTVEPSDFLNHILDNTREGLPPQPDIVRTGANNDVLKACFNNDTSNVSETAIGTVTVVLNPNREAISGTIGSVPTETPTPTLTETPTPTLTETPTPTLTETPTIPSKDRFSKTTKAIFSGAADVSGFLSSVAGGIPAFLRNATPRQLRWLAALSIALTGLNIAANRLASDPPDPNFQVIAHPALSPVQHVIAGKGITQREADAINTLDDNLIRVAALENALLTSINRAQGAFLAGNKVWEAKQLKAAHLYARQAAKLLKAEPKLFANVRYAFKSTKLANVPVISIFFQLLTSRSMTSTILKSAQALEQFAAGK